MPTTLSTTPFIAWCTVLETASHIRSSVVGGGGGGFSYEGTGFSHVSPVETVHEKLHEFWVRYDNGVEDRLDFRNIDVPARGGHRLAVLFQDKSILAVRNLSTGLRTVTVTPETYAGPKPSMGCGTVVAWSLLAGIGLLFAALHVGPLLSRLSRAPALQDGTQAFLLVCNPLTALAFGGAFNFVFHRWARGKYQARHDQARRFLEHWLSQLDQTPPPENTTAAPPATRLG